MVGPRLVRLRDSELRLNTTMHTELSRLDELFVGERDFQRSYDVRANPPLPSWVFEHGALPSGGVLDNSVMLTCLLSDSPVGYCYLYLGYPSRNAAMIQGFFLDEVVRGAGRGSRFFRLLHSWLMEQRMERARISVSLKNWPGLRFCLRQGYVRVTKVTGDPTFGPESYAVLELERVLRRAREVG